MCTYSAETPLLPSQKATAALSVIRHDRTISTIAEETGASVEEVERWVSIIRECAQELFSSHWGMQRPKAPILKNDLVVLQKQLLRLNAKIAHVLET